MHCHDLLPIESLIIVCDCLNITLTSHIYKTCLFNITKSFFELPIVDPYIAQFIQFNLPFI